MSANWMYDCNLGKTELHLAAVHNDIHRMKKLIFLQKADVNAGDAGNSTPLHDAAISNKNDSHLKTAELLFKNGANVEARDNTGATPFWYLVKNGNVKIVQLFLNFKADFGVVNFYGNNLLFPVVENSENVEVLQTLLNLGLDVNHRCFLKNTPLHKAAISNVDESHLKMVEVLLQVGADPNARNCDGRTPFWFLVRFGNSKMVQFFMDYKADIHALDNQEYNLLFPAVRYNYNFKVLELLISCGLDINHRNQEKKTPLQYACESIFKNDETVKFLLSNSAKVDGSSFEKISDRSWKMILNYIAKLQPLESVQSIFLNSVDEYSDYYKRCREELFKAKMTKLKNSWVSFYDLLTNSKKRLRNYAGNKDLVEDFKNCNCVEKFPVYGAAMDENVEKGMKRRKLFDESAILLSGCLPVFSPSHLIIRDILDCMPGTKDLSKFCE